MWSPTMSNLHLSHHMILDTEVFSRRMRYLYNAWTVRIFVCFLPSTWCVPIYDTFQYMALCGLNFTESRAFNRKCCSIERWLFRSISWWWLQWVDIIPCKYCRLVCSSFACNLWETVVYSFPPLCLHLQKWLFGYELNNTICVFTRDMVYILVSQKGAKFLKDTANHVTPTVQLLVRCCVS